MQLREGMTSRSMHTAGVVPAIEATQLYMVTFIVLWLCAETQKWVAAVE